MMAFWREVNLLGKMVIQRHCCLEGMRVGGIGVLGVERVCVLIRVGLSSLRTSLRRQSAISFFWPRVERVGMFMNEWNGRDGTRG